MLLSTRRQYYRYNQLDTGTARHSYDYSLAPAHFYQMNPNPWYQRTSGNPAPKPTKNPPYITNKWLISTTTARIGWPFQHFFFLDYNLTSDFNLVQHVNAVLDLASLSCSKVRHLTYPCRVLGKRCGFRPFCGWE